MILGGGLNRKIFI